MKSRRSGDFDKKVESTMKDVEKLTQELEEEKVKRRQEVYVSCIHLSLRILDLTMLTFSSFIIISSMPIVEIENGRCILGYSIPKV